MDYQQLAAQLRCPEGEFGMEVAARMNENNGYVNRRAIDLLNIGVSEKVLEVGMANGYFCEEIVRTRQAFYYGCDFSEAMVTAAKEKNAKRVETSQAHFYLCEASKLPFPDQFFDKFFTVNTLYFWEHPQRELQEIKRVMKPGGKIVIAIRSRHSMEKLPMVKYGFKLYNLTELHEVLEQADFSDVKVLQEDEPVITVEGNAMNLESLFGIGYK